jgi:hypothetical protein
MIMKDNQEGMIMKDKVRTRVEPEVMMQFLEYSQLCQLVKKYSQLCQLFEYANHDMTSDDARKFAGTVFEIMHS